ncbi:MAG: HAMP domain-containing protein [Candidatus Staskawiczbacteria bacterium]|nr:HAMP domain-containing protein [Candidatus Staskawiczbacteria bacterium]
MSKISSKIAVPIMLVGFFAIAVFIGIDHEKLNPEFYIILGLFIVYVFLFGLAIGQNLSSPVKKLLDKANELSKGNLSSRVYLETKDEFAELAKAFNKIAEDLEESHVQGENAEKSVGIKVKARTQELEETIQALEQKVKNRTIELERLVGESSKLQADAKNKEIEVGQLRKEMSSFKQKLGKYSKPKKPALKKSAISKKRNI